MGNKQSSAKTGSEGVKKRTKKDGQRAAERPMSMPGPVYEDPGGAIRRAGSVDLGNLSQVNQQPDPLSGRSEIAGETVFNLYKRNLHKVLDLWPELAPLREIDPLQISGRAIGALQQIYDMVFRSNEQMDKLQREKQGLNDYISGLQMRSDRQIEELRKKDNEIGDLDHNIGILQGELRRRGISPKSPGMEDTNPNRSSFDYEGDLERNGNVNRMSKRNSGMRPTPFLQAGGIRGQDAAIKRSNSRLTDGQRTGVVVGKSADTSAMLEDLTQKVRNLQFALESKQKENNELTNRLEGGFNSRSSLKQFAPQSGPSLESMIDFFDELEGRAMVKVTNSITERLRDRTEEAVRQFLCFTMETAFQQATSMMQAFLDTVHALLINPLNPAVAETDAKGSRSQGLVDKRMFERVPDLQAMSRLARRTRLTTELPKYLEEEVASFIRVTSDSTNIDILIEEAQNKLRQKFPDYATDNVFYDNNYSDFLTGCCRLAWQLCAMSPPCHVTIDDTRTRYDERYHDVLPSQKLFKVTIGAEIDYFVWPMLLRKKNGEVLYKARVSLTQPTGQKF